MAMRDDGAVDRASRIDEEIAQRAVKAFGSGLQPSRKRCVHEVLLLIALI
jgi:hypothetical protein